MSHLPSYLHPPGIYYVCNIFTLLPTVFTYICDI